MARIHKGILSGFSGKVGTVIGYTQDGKDYMRSAPAEDSRPKSTHEGEIANRKKFAMAQSFLTPLVEVVREGFRNEDRLGRGYVDAKGHLLKNAFEGELENQRINPAKVVISVGDLHMPTNIACSKRTGWIDITWDTVAKWAADSKDQAIAIAYDIENEIVYGDINGEFRYKGADSIQVGDTPGRKLHVYLAFISANREQRSESVYLGEWTT